MFLYIKIVNTNRLATCSFMLSLTHLEARRLATPPLAPSPFPTRERSVPASLLAAAAPGVWGCCWIDDARLLLFGSQVCSTRTTSYRGARRKDNSSVNSGRGRVVVTTTAGSAPTIDPLAFSAIERERSSFDAHDCVLCPLLQSAQRGHNNSTVRPQASKTPSKVTLFLLRNEKTLEI